MEHPRYRATENGLTVGFIFGALTASELSGPVLIALLGGLGLQESAARNALTRMVRMSALESRRSGRISLFRLAPHPLQKYRQIEGALDGAPWDGSFRCLIYDIPERERSFRDRFRSLAGFASYGQLRPGVMISPRVHSSHLDEVIAQRPHDTRIHLTELRPTDLSEARRMALEAWALPELGSRYLKVTAAIEEALQSDITADQSDPAWFWTHLDQWRRIYSGVSRLQFDDPSLPHSLLPPRWPAHRYWNRLNQLNQLWGPHLVPPLRQLADSLDPAGLCQYYTPPWASTEAEAVGQ